MPATVAKDVADEILTQLGQGFTMPTVDINDPAFNLPNITNNPLYASVPKIEVDDLTTRVVDGTGVFDKLMTANKMHLKEQYERGLITGDQYTKAYIELTSLAMQTGLQFLLQKDQNYWNGILVQAQARKAEVEAVQAAVQLQIAKFQLLVTQSQASQAEAQYVLTLMQVANVDAEYALKLRQISLADVQERLTEEQYETQRGQTLDTRSDGTPIEGMMGVQRLLADEQINTAQNQTLLTLEQMESQRSQTTDTRSDGTPMAGLVVVQKALAQKQVDIAAFQELLVQEQAEAQRGQTTDIRLDGLPVTGLLGRQKDLYAQQIDSYQKDAEHKVAKMYLDSWITQKTLDDGLLPPPQLTNAQVDLVMTQARTNVGL
jgi:hypothetical protein